MITKTEERIVVNAVNVLAGLFCGVFWMALLKLAAWAVAPDADVMPWLRWVGLGVAVAVVMVLRFVQHRK